MNRPQFKPGLIIYDLSVFNDLLAIGDGIRDLSQVGKGREGPGRSIIRKLALDSAATGVVHAGPGWSTTCEEGTPRADGWVVVIRHQALPVCMVRSTARSL